MWLSDLSTDTHNLSTTRTLSILLGSVGTGGGGKQGMQQSNYSVWEIQELSSWICLGQCECKIKTELLLFLAPIIWRPQERSASCSRDFPASCCNMIASASHLQGLSDLISSCYSLLLFSPCRAWALTIVWEFPMSHLCSFRHMLLYGERGHSLLISFWFFIKL